MAQMFWIVIGLKISLRLVPSPTLPPYVARVAISSHLIITWHSTFRHAGCKDTGNCTMKPRSSLPSSQPLSQAHNWECYDLFTFFAYLISSQHLSIHAITSTKLNDSSIPTDTHGYRQTSWQVSYNFRISNAIFKCRLFIYKNLNYQPCTPASS